MSKLSFHLSVHHSIIACALCSKRQVKCCLLVTRLRCLVSKLFDLSFPFITTLLNQASNQPIASNFVLFSCFPSIMPYWVFFSFRLTPSLYFSNVQKYIYLSMDINFFLILIFFSCGDVYLYLLLQPIHFFFLLWFNMGNTNGAFNCVVSQRFI